MDWLLILCMLEGDILKAVLSLYMKDPNLPLPSSAEVCICTPNTTAEEVTHLLAYTVAHCIQKYSTQLQVFLFLH